MIIGGIATDLVYNIVEELLEGRVDGTAIRAHAVAGGRAGSKTPGAVNPLLANNPYATTVKKLGLDPGGPLIMGTYSLRTHESRPNWIRLEPISGTFMHGRDAFAIHGRGPRGSDGCIVPTEFHVVVRLHQLVKARESVRRTAPTLAVVSIGDLDAVDQKLKGWMSLA